MRTDEQATGTSLALTAQDWRLILAEIRAMRAEMRAARLAKRSPHPREEFDLVAAITDLRTPAEILADHEQRLRALEKKTSLRESAR